MICPSMISKNEDAVDENTPLGVLLVPWGEGMGRQEHHLSRMRMLC